MIFADDIVLIGENLEEVNNRLEKWRSALKEKELRIGWNKTEYMEYDFEGRYQKFEGIRRPITINGYVIGEDKNLKYLGSFVQKDGNFGMDVKHKIEWD
jgi:hypothetical protein